jgi:hypothetical protein
VRTIIRPGPTYLAPVHASIRRGDVTGPLPFADCTFEAIYHSHLLEHLRRELALPFLRECHRVLRPGGVLRIAVPDLEAIVRLYLQALDDAERGDADARERHRWLVMELYDQTTREASGGGMRSYLDQKESALAWYRLGRDGAILRQELRSLALPAGRVGWRERFRGWLFGCWRERLVRCLLGDEYPLLQLGRFRRSGEVHHWMYDRVSLRELLTVAGFVDFRCVGPMESAIPRWDEYHLDVTADGQVCKPDSLYVEADKP